MNLFSYKYVQLCTNQKLKNIHMTSGKKLTSNAKKISKNEIRYMYMYLSLKHTAKKVYMYKSQVHSLITQLLASFKLVDKVSVKIHRTQ